MPRDNRCMYMAHVCFYVCCSDCVGVCGNVCCVAAVVKNSVFFRCKVNTGVPHGSKLSPSLFSFYIADMPRPTEQVKWVCYADELTVCATRVKIPDLEDSINSYLEDITTYLKDNPLMITTPKSSVALFSPDPHQAKTHPRILIEDSQLPLAQCPKILGVYLYISLSFNKHIGYMAERVSSRKNILKALAGTSWGQQKEALLMTYNAVGRSIINYAAPVIVDS